MNLPTPTPKTKRSHYQERRAHADGWDIELLSYGVHWLISNKPPFNEAQEYRIVPDENGWLPWYPTEDSECPVANNALVDLILIDYTNDTTSSYGENIFWRVGSTVTHYRPHKERKLVKTVKLFDDGTAEEV